jgi:cobalt-zinc-cadmium efflux system outer membrane protein
MKSLPIIIFLSLFCIYASSGWAEDGDYKTMIQEFEKFRSTYQADLKNKEPSQMDSSLEHPQPDIEITELQQRWDKLVRRIFEKDSFFYIDTNAIKEMEGVKNSQKTATAYLQAHPNSVSFLKVVFVRNLYLQSVKKKMESKLESYSQVTQLEDVLSQFSTFVKELDTRAGQALHKTSIKQSYPFPGALTLKANIAEQEVRIAKTKYEIALRDTVTQVKEAFYDWSYLNQAISITEEHLKLLQELEAVASVHFRTGKGGFNDVIKAQIKISKLKDDLINLKEEHGVVEANLAWFLNFNSPFSLDVSPGDTLIPLGLADPKLSDIALKHQQELLLHLEEIKKSRMAIELAEKKYYPDLSPGLSYFEDRKLKGAGNMDASVNVDGRPETTPQYWFGENDAYIREAKLHHQALLKNLENHKQGLRFEVKQFFYELDKSERAVSLYTNSLLPLAQKALEVSITEYKTGKTDFLSLLDAQTTLLHFGIDYQMALRNHGQNRARLEKLIGKQLPEVEVKNEIKK